MKRIEISKILIGFVSAKDRFARSGLLSIALRLLNMGLGFLVAVLLARSLGVEGYGAYSFIFAIVSVVVIPAQFGLPALLVRETAKNKKTKQFAEMKSLWVWSTKVGVSLALIASLAIFLGFMVIQRFSEWPEEVGLSSPLVFWASLLLPFLVLGALRGGALRGFGLIVWGQLPEDIIRPALFVLSMAFYVLVFGQTLSSAEAMMLHTIAAAIAFLIGGVVFLRASRPVVLSKIATRQQPKKWIRSAVPMTVNSSSQMINRNADVILLGVLSTMLDIAAYRVASQASVFVGVGLMGLNLVAAPKIASHFAARNYKGLQSIAEFTSRISFLVAIPPAVLFIFYGEYLLGWIFGPEYVHAYVPLLILMVGQLFNAVVGPVGLLLSMCGHERLVAKTLIFSVALNILLNIVLIPFFGAIGAAAATSISMSAWNLYLSRRVKQKLGVESFAFARVKSRT